MEISREMKIILLILLVVASSLGTAYAVATYYASISGQVTVTSGSSGPLMVSPTSISVSGAVGSSITQALTISNTGSVALTLNQPTITGIGCGFFSVSLDKAGTAVQPSQSISATLTITINSCAQVGTYAVTITLSATG